MRTLTIEELNQVSGAGDKCNEPKKDKCKPEHPHGKPPGQRKKDCYPKKKY